MSREMDEYGIPGEEHVSDAEIWEVKQRYASNPAQARAALRNMGYDGPQLYDDPKPSARTRTPKLDAMRRSMQGSREQAHEAGGPDFDAGY